MTLSNSVRVLLGNFVKGIRCVAEFIILVLKKLLLNCMSYMGAADEMELNASL